MSIQVSYGKQTSFFILFLFLVLISFEGMIRIYEHFEPDCFIVGADATENLGLELQNEMCEESKILQINDFPIYHAEPNQKLTTINVNSDGFRGNEIEKTKNVGTYRIMMIGGSTTWGSGASSDETTIPAYLEKEFQNKNFNVEVVNAGVPTSSSIEEAYKMRNIFNEFNPDLYLIYNGWNDSVGKLQEGDLNLEISRTEFLQSQKSPIQIFISEYLREYRTPFVLHPLFSHMYIASTMNGELLQKNAEIWNSRWEKVCNENNQDGIKTIILLQPIVGTGNKQLSPDEKHHSDYIKQIKSREQLEFFSKQMPIAHCTASIDLRNTYDDTSESIYFDGGHTTDLGNEIMAKKIYEEILPIIENYIKFEQDV